MIKKIIMSIDPSGQGTTGLCLVDETTGKMEFDEIADIDWQNHLDGIIEIKQKWNPDIIVYENTNRVQTTNKGPAMTNLFRLMGGIEALSRFFPNLKVTFSLVNVVKPLHKKLYDYKELKERWPDFIKDEAIIKGLSYKDGRPKKGEVSGWLWEGKKISVHQLDALLVYYLWKRNCSTSKSL